MSTDAEEQAMVAGDPGCEEQLCDQEQEYVETNLTDEEWL